MVFGIFTALVMKKLCFPASASRSASQSGIWLKLFVFFLAGLSSLFYSQSVFAQNSLTALRLGNVEIDGQTALRLVVETVALQPAKMLLLSEPYRLVLDYQNMEWAVEGLATSGQLDHLPATAYRFGHPQPDAGRLVIEAVHPASPERAFTLPPNRTGHRLVIDLMDRGEISFSLAQKALPAAAFNQPHRQRCKIRYLRPLAHQICNQVRQLRPACPGVLLPLVCLSPARNAGSWQSMRGHGGKDPGAIGKRGSREKDITLAAAAKQLVKHMNASGKITARLVRSGDRYLKLRQRNSNCP